MTAGNFTAEETPLPGLLLVRCRPFADPRGFLYESWREESFAALGIAGPFVQDNHSRSRKGVLRGLHWQTPPHAQGKLVRCTRGRVWDVAVDIRLGSPTFGKHFGATLSQSDDPPSMLWVPPGFAHGFVAMETDSEVQYRCSAYWDAASERTLRWDDPEVAVPWPIPEGTPRISEKDRKGMTLAEYREEPSFRWEEPS